MYIIIRVFYCFFFRLSSGIFESRSEAPAEGTWPLPPERRRRGQARPAFLPRKWPVWQGISAYSEEARLILHGQLIGIFIARDKIKSDAYCMHVAK